MFKIFKSVGLKKVILALSLCAVTATAQESNAKKLVILDPAVVEIVYMLEAQDQIAAIATLTMSQIWPQEQTSKLKSVGTYTKPNLEQVVELKPNLVITSFHSAGANEDLKKFNLPTLTLKADSVDMVYENIAKMGEITGKQSKANEVIAGIKDKFKAFESSNLKGKKVVAFFSGNPMTAFSSKTLPGDIFSKMGLVNLADKLQGDTPIISSEFILSNNPDFIVVVGGMGGSDNLLAQNPILKNTTAAKNGKILTIPSSILLRGTPRIGEGVQSVYEEMIK